MVVNPFPTDQSLQKPVCVFCGASPGTSPLYAKAAESVGQALAKSNIPLVFGGGRRGIMGVVSQATIDAGGYVHGVLPRALVERASEYTPSAAGTSNGQAKSGEGSGKDLLQDGVDGRLSMEIVGGMHERKGKMAELSTGGFIVLPGGYGTFEEVLEMITWNQLGIHSLPVIILNIGNFYTSLLSLFENAVKAGFIKPENLSLMRIVNLPGGESDNESEEKVDQWGEAAIKALKEWSIAEGAGYGMKWTGKDELDSLHHRRVNLFTTLRYTSNPLRSGPIRKEEIPLLDRHIGRIREAHSYFSSRDGVEIWGEWVGDEVVWDTLRGKLEERELSEKGDWRVRVVYKHGGNIDIEIFPAPPGGFNFTIPTERPATRRPLILDPIDTIIEQDNTEVDCRLYKTTHRDIYDQAAKRAASLHPNISPPPEIILHTPTHLLETQTSNLAILYPSTNTHSGGWITPTLHRTETPFLAGVMRGYLLSIGAISEGEVGVRDFERARREGWRVIGFNGLRGVWEAELI